MLALLALAVLSPSPHDVGAPTATPDAVRPRVACLPDAELPLLSHVQPLLRKHAAAAYDCCANFMANESVLDGFDSQLVVRLALPEQLELTCPCAQRYRNPAGSCPAPSSFAAINDLHLAVRAFELHHQHQQHQWYQV